MSKISPKSDNRLLSYAQKRFLLWRRSAILNFENVHIWSPDCHRVPDILLCTNFHQNRMVFRWDMAIARFSRCRMSAILNFRSPIVSSLKSPCTTSYRSSMETIALNCLVFEKIAFLCTHFGIRRTKLTVGHHQCVKQLARYRQRPLNNDSAVCVYVLQEKRK